MKKKDVLKILKNNLNFSEISIHKIDKFQKFLIDYNKSYNLISESTEISALFDHIFSGQQDYVRPSSLVQLVLSYRLF